MKKGLIAIISGVVGIGIGAAAGYVFGKKKMAEQCARDIEEMRDYYEKKGRLAGSERAKEIIAERAAEVINTVKEPPQAQQETDYTKYYRTTEQPETRSTSTIESATVMEPEEPNCRIISDEEFDTDTTFKSETLYFYDVDGVLATEDDEIVSDNLVGGMDLIREAISSIEGNIFFISNTDEETNYEVIILDKSYAEDVAGYPGANGKVRGGVND